jgi:hypothetical protein
MQHGRASEGHQVPRLSQSMVYRSVKYTDVPNRGTLATISTPDKSFECHLNLSKVGACCWLLAMPGVMTIGSVASIAKTGDCNRAILLLPHTMPGLPHPHVLEQQQSA